MKKIKKIIDVDKLTPAPLDNKQGWFANYHSNAWRHDTFYGAYIWKYPKLIKFVKVDLLARDGGHETVLRVLTKDCTVA